MLDENYYVVQGWMINRLGLSGNELIVYAIIYGFSQNEDQFCEVGLNYLAEASGSTKRTILRSLDSLIEKGFLIKKENYIGGIKFCSYKALCQNVTGSDKMSPVVTEMHETDDKMSPNNKIINNNKKENITSLLKEKEIKHSFGEYKRVSLTTTEYDRLCAEFGKDVIDNQIKLVDEYVEANDNKNQYKNYNLVIRKSLRDNWFRTSRTTPIQTKTNPEWLDGYVSSFEDNVQNL